MTFKIHGKVGLVTGGASGIGIHLVKELLRHGAKGVTIADVNADFGKSALKEIKAEFGLNKAIFVTTDVSDLKQFTEAFKKTVEQFGHIDILINNAGIWDDTQFEKTVAVNIHGLIHGMLLGLEDYILKHKSGEEGVIVNFASVAAIAPVGAAPVYTATKAGILGASKAWGDQAHYERTKIKTLCICPGVTETPIISENLPNRLLGPSYVQMLGTCGFTVQKPEHVGKCVMGVIETAKTGTIWVIEGGEEPYEFVLPARETFIVKK